LLNKRYLLNFPRNN